MKPKNLVLFGALAILAMLVIMPNVNATTSYTINTTQLPFSVQENIVIFANETSIVTITSDNWLTPSTNSHQMNNNSNFTLAINILIPANTLAGNYSKNVNWTANWDNTSSSDSKTFNFEINNVTLPSQILPNLKFTIIDSNSDDKIANALINISTSDFTNSGITNSNGQYTFFSLAQKCYDYIITQLDYHTVYDQVCLDNTTNGTTTDRRISLSMIETNTNNSSNQTNSTNDTQNTNYNSLESQLAFYQDSNKNKDSTIANITNNLNYLSSTCVQNENNLTTTNNNLVQQINGFKNKLYLGIGGTTILSIFGTLGGLYIKANGIIWRFF